VEITNLGPVERAHGRERGAIVAVYAGKGQGMGQAGFLFKGFSRSSEPCLRFELADMEGMNWGAGKPIPPLGTLFGCCQATQQRHQHFVQYRPRPHLSTPAGAWCVQKDESL